MFSGYPMLPFDEGDWCECCGKMQPILNGKCAVCGNGYDDCQEDDIDDIIDFNALSEHHNLLWNIQDEQIKGDKQ